MANNKEMLKRNFYLMNKRAIDLYAKGSPFAFVVPPDQRDRVAAAKLVQLVQAEAGEVHVAQAAFTADGKEYPAGTHVMLLAQPFGRWIKDLLEPQRYPDIRWPFNERADRSALRRVGLDARHADGCDDDQSGQPLRRDADASDGGGGGTAGTHQRQREMSSSSTTT